MKVKDIYIYDYIPVVDVVTFTIVVYAILSYFSILSKNKYKTEMVIFIFVLIASLFYGIRVIPQMTFDSMRYVHLWFPELTSLDEVFNGSVSWKQDYVFFIIPYFVHLFSDSKIIYLFVNSLLSITLLIYGYKKLFNKEDYYVIPLFIFSLLITSTVVANYGNLLRQGLVISFFIFAIPFMLRKKYFYGYLIIILALYTHKSSLLILPVFLIVFHTNIHIKYYFYLFLSSLVFLQIDTTPYFIQFMGANESESIVIDKMAAYQESNSRMLYVKVVFFIIMSSILYFYKSKIKAINFEQLFKIYLLIITVSFLFFSFQIISGRLMYLAAILLPYFMYAIYSGLTNQYKKYFIIYYTVFTIGYAYFILKFSSTYETLIYQNLLF